MLWFLLCTQLNIAYTNHSLRTLDEKVALNKNDTFDTHYCIIHMSNKNLSLLLCHCHGASISHESVCVYSEEIKSPKPTMIHILHS